MAIALAILLAAAPVMTPEVPKPLSTAPVERRRFSMRKSVLASSPATYIYVESMAMAMAVSLSLAPVMTPEVPKPVSTAPVERRRFSMRQSRVSSYPATYMYVESMAIALTTRLAVAPVMTPEVPKPVSTAPVERRRFSMRQSPVPSAPVTYIYVESMAMALAISLAASPVMTPEVPKGDKTAPGDALSTVIVAESVSVPAVEFVAVMAVTVAVVAELAPGNPG